MGIYVCIQYVQGVCYSGQYYIEIPPFAINILQLYQLSFIIYTQKTVVFRSSCYLIKAIQDIVVAFVVVNDKVDGSSLGTVYNG